MLLSYRDTSQCRNKDIEHLYRHQSTFVRSSLGDCARKSNRRTAGASTLTLSARTRADDEVQKSNLAPAAAEAVTLANTEASEDEGLLQAEETERQIEKYLAAGLASIAALGFAGYCISTGQNPSQVLASLSTVDPKQLLEASVIRVEELGTLGYLYFAAVYIVAEMLAIPAVPLTASAGYLFGVAMGTVVVLFSATVAAGGAFIIGRTFLRQWVERFISKSKKFQSIDEAISRKGFQLVLLLRLSPLLPFALSNYLYGMTKVDFWQYLAGTLLGFAPGSLAFVLTGHLGRELSGINSEGAAIPWYGYAAGLGAILVIGRLVTRVASQALAEVEAEQQV